MKQCWECGHVDTRRGIIEHRREHRKFRKAMDEMAEPATEVETAWEYAFEEVLQTVENDHEQAGYDDDAESVAVRRYTKDLIAYIKQIKPR